MHPELVDADIYERKHIWSDDVLDNHIVLVDYTEIFIFIYVIIIIFLTKKAVLTRKYLIDVPQILQVKRVKITKLVF